MDLFEIREKYHTKSNYMAGIYHFIFEQIRSSVQKVIEIGIGTLNPGAHSTMCGYASKEYKPGNSLRMWRDYFPKAMVFGFDVAPDTQFTENRIKTFLCNSTDPAEVAKAQIVIGADTPVDFITDDGSHRPEDQLATMKNFFPMLGPIGVYVIEDVYKDIYLDVREICKSAKEIYMRREMILIFGGGLDKGHI